MRTGSPLLHARYMFVSVVVSISLLIATPVIAAADESNSAPQNVVQVINTKDRQLQVDGNVQLNEIPGPTARPLNEAYAYSSCTDCQTFAVALQVDFISKTSTDIQPENYAVAVNYQCTRCTTVANAYQYVIQVDDPRHVPEYVSERIAQLNRQLREVMSEEDASASEVQARINDVVSEFQQLVQNLNSQHKGRENVQHDAQHD